jgi:hypothetical protein
VTRRDPAVPLLLEAKVREQTVSLRSHIPTFAAIDFETADYSRDSACAIAVVRVEGLAIVERAYYYIRPPHRQFMFSYLRGLLAIFGEVESAGTSEREMESSSLRNDAVFPAVLWTEKRCKTSKPPRFTKTGQEPR